MNNEELLQQQNAVTLTPELTDAENEQYAKTCEELAKKYNVSKVWPVVAIDPDTYRRVVCYIKEPNYDTKVRILDKMQQVGGFTAGEEMRKICTLTAESDPITYSDSPESDKYKLGILDECVTLIVKIQNQFKKKSKTLK